MQVKEISRDGHGRKKEKSRGLIQTKKWNVLYNIFFLSEILDFALMFFFVSVVLVLIQNKYPVRLSMSERYLLL